MVRRSSRTDTKAVMTIRISKKTYARLVAQADRHDVKTATLAGEILERAVSGGAAVRDERATMKVVDIKDLEKVIGAHFYLMMRHEELRGGKELSDKVDAEVRQRATERARMFCDAAAEGVE